MAALILCEHDGSSLSPAICRVVTAAAALGGPVDLRVVGEDCDGIAAEAARLAPVREVLVAETGALAYPVAELLAPILASLADGYDAVLAAASTTGRDVMPRLAGLLQLPQVSEITAVIDPRTFEHPTYAGNVLQTVRVRDGKVVLTVRSSAFPPAAQQVQAGIRNIVPAIESNHPTVVEQSRKQSDRPDLGSARVVVSGGRALASRQQFDGLLEPLADVLGAAIGASRAAVDAGYAPNHLQVGQTGRMVAPQIYIAIGISGAIQHLAGMQNARTIVAINSDARAPIFEIADYALVGDLFEIVPALIEELKR